MVRPKEGGGIAFNHALLQPVESEAANSRAWSRMEQLVMTASNKNIQ